MVGVVGALVLVYQLAGVMVRVGEWSWMANRSGCESRSRNACLALSVVPSSTGLVESRVNLPGPPGKPEYFQMTDSGSVP